MGLFQNKKTVVFKDKKYDVKIPCLGATFLWEEMQGKSIADMNTTKDQVAFAYCLLKANNESFNFSFEEYYTELDKDISSFDEILKLALKKKEVR